MGMTEITWELDGGQISAEESVRKLVEVIRSKKLDHTGTFWTWENEVSLVFCPSFSGIGVENHRNIPGDLELGTSGGSRMGLF